MRKLLAGAAVAALLLGGCGQPAEPTEACVAFAEAANAVIEQNNMLLEAGGDYIDALHAGDDEAAETARARVSVITATAQPYFDAYAAKQAACLGTQA
jgi:hypothetical protein